MSQKTMEITTMIGCPLMCTYCPQDNLRDAYGRDDDKYMSLETFKTAVDKLPWDCRIDFSGMAEPWVNPACTDMLEYALKNDRQVAIFTTLYNWDEATVHRVGELLIEHAAQIEIFKIHFPDEASNMKGWRPSEEWDYAYIGMREIVHAAGIHYEAMTMSDHGVHPGIHHLPGIGVSHSWSISAHDRAGTLNREQIKEQPVVFTIEHKNPVVCGKTSLYDQNVLLPNGDVVLCCMDYDNKHILGNLVKQKYEDLFTGPEITKLLAINAEPCYNSGSLCKSCSDAKSI